MDGASGRSSLFECVCGLRVVRPNGRQWRRYADLLNQAGDLGAKFFRQLLECLVLTNLFQRFVEHRRLLGQNLLAAIEH